MPIRKAENIEREFMPSKKSIIVSLEPNDFDIDEDLKKLRKVMIKPTYNNLEEAFWNDSISTSFTNITASVIIGDGLRIRCKNIKALKIIKEWNRNVNVQRQTIEDYIRDSWFDSIIYGKSFWRVDDRSIEYEDVDVQRLDPKTIEIKIDPVMGYRQFIQHIDSFKYHRTKKAFYRDKSDESLSHQVDWERDKQKVNYGKDVDSLSIKEQKIWIPDEPNNVLFTDFFKKPPISNALHFIVYKRWILWYMRKYSQKHWAPFILAKVGDPKSNSYPSDPQKMQAAINNMQQVIKQITNWGGLSYPGEVDIKTLETQTGRSSEIYVMYVKELDKQIMYAIFGSMGQREASGNELATSRILEKGWLRFIKGIRREYELNLTNFYSKVLLPYHGISNIIAIDIDVDWSELRFDSTQELMNSIEKGANVGVFKDTNELRKAAQPAFSFLIELPENENKKIELPDKNAGEQNKASAKGRLMEHYEQRRD